MTAADSTSCQASVGRQPSQAIGWDRGRPARKRAEGREGLVRCCFSFQFALSARCGRDARGPSKSLDWFQTQPQNF